MGLTEILIIVLVIVVIFGGSRLPGLGSALGRSIVNFKKALKGSDQDAIDVTPKKKQEPRAPGEDE